MSNIYRPDNWVVLKFKGDDPHYRVLAGWSGGYTTGDSWRMNSGITGVNETEEYYYFSGSSGSEYRCSKGSYMLRQALLSLPVPGPCWQPCLVSSASLRC